MHQGLWLHSRGGVLCKIVHETDSVLHHLTNRMRTKGLTPSTSLANKARHEAIKLRNSKLHGAEDGCWLVGRNVELQVNRGG